MLLPYILTAFLVLSSTASARPVPGAPLASKMRGCQVTITNMVPNTTLAVVAVSQENEYTGPPTFLEYEQATFFSRPFRGEYITPDLRVRVYATKEGSQGKPVLGEMRQVYTCYNPSVGNPRFGVHAKPFERNGRMLNSYQYASLDEDASAHMDDLDQGTYVHRDADNSSHKSFSVELHTLSPVATEDYPLNGVPF